MPWHDKIAEWTKDYRRAPKGTAPLTEDEKVLLGSEASAVTTRQTILSKDSVSQVEFEIDPARYTGPGWL